MKDRHPFSDLTTVKLLNGVIIDNGDAEWKGVQTHNYETSCEHGITMASWTGAYRSYVMKHGGVHPDDVYHGGVPVL